MDISQKIRNAFYIAASHLPTLLAQEFMGADWYNTNNHYKYPVGTILDAHTYSDGKVVYFGYGEKPFGWKVVAHTKNKFGRDSYNIETPDGEVQNHFKWNIEFQFKKRPMRQIESEPSAQLK